MSKSVTLTIRLSEEDKAKLSGFAAADDRSINYCINQAVKQYLSLRQAEETAAKNKK